MNSADGTQPDVDPLTEQKAAPDSRTETQQPETPATKTEEQSASVPDSARKKRRTAGLVVGAVSILCLALALFLIAGAPGPEGGSGDMNRTSASGSLDRSVQADTVDNGADTNREASGAEDTGEADDTPRPSDSGHANTRPDAGRPGSTDGDHHESPSGENTSGGNASNGGSEGSSHSSGEKPSPITVTVSVNSSAAADKGFPASLFSGSVTIPSDGTAYDALAATGLSIGGSPSYVTSIGGLAEKTVGPNSGWTYDVNGTMPMVAANAYQLAQGDRVSWTFVI